MLDICEHCRRSIYPDDEKVIHLFDTYHLECAEGLNLEDPEDLPELEE